jgi:hypothetical protein
MTTSEAALPSLAVLFAMILGLQLRFTAKVQFRKWYSLCNCKGGIYRIGNLKLPKGSLRNSDIYAILASVQVGLSDSLISVPHYNDAFSQTSGHRSTRRASRPTSSPYVSTRLVGRRIVEWVTRGLGGCINVDALWMLCEWMPPYQKAKSLVADAIFKSFVC